VACSARSLPSPGLFLKPLSLVRRSSSICLSLALANPLSTTSSHSRPDHSHARPLHRIRHPYSIHAWLDLLDPLPEPNPVSLCLHFVFALSSTCGLTSAVSQVRVREFDGERVQWSEVPVRADCPVSLLSSLRALLQTKLILDRSFARTGPGYPGALSTGVVCSVAGSVPGRAYRSTSFYSNAPCRANPKSDVPPHLLPEDYVDGAEYLSLNYSYLNSHKWRYVAPVLLSWS
jgi:hypothetical protein